MRLSGGGEAYVALIATRLAADDAEAVEFLGQVRWTDGDDGLTLTSRDILRYGPLPNEERGREAVGLAQATGVEGEVPFALRVVVSDPAGTEPSTVRLVAGNAALPSLEGLVAQVPKPSGFEYEAEDDLVDGGLVLLRLEVPAPVS